MLLKIISVIYKNSKVKGVKGGKDKYKVGITQIHYFNEEYLVLITWFYN